MAEGMEGLFLNGVTPQISFNLGIIELLGCVA